MLTDAKRVELALPLYIALDVLLNGVEEEDAEYKATREALLAAVDEVFSDLMPAKRAKLLRRCEREHSVTIGYGAAHEGELVAKTGLVLFYLLRTLTESDYLVIPDGSAFSRALDLLLPALQWAADEERLNASAEKQARKLLAALRDRGYYVGVEVMT